MVTYVFFFFRSVYKIVNRYSNDIQGLKSKDVRILHDVLLDKDENVIRTTVSRLPIEAVLPLSVELISMLQGKRTE